MRATEGYTHSLAGMVRDLVPVYSLIVATEPLPASTWERIGLRERETFTDHRNLIIYGQRTADDRLVFGGRPWLSGGILGALSDQYRGQTNRSRRKVHCRQLKTVPRGAH